MGRSIAESMLYECRSKSNIGIKEKQVLSRASLENVSSI